MPPHRLAGAHPVAGDDLVAAALLLRVEEVAVHGERRPARADRPAPHLRPAATATSRSRSARRESRCRDRVRESRATPHASPAAVRQVWRAPLLEPPAALAARYRRRCRRRGGLDISAAPGRRERLGLVGGLSEKPLLGSLRPAQVEIRPPVGVDATGPHQHPRQASEHDGDDRRGAARSRARDDGSPPPRRRARRSGSGSQGCSSSSPSRRRQSTGGRRTFPRTTAAIIRTIAPQALVPARAAEEQPPQDDDRARRRAAQSIARPAYRGRRWGRHIRPARGAPRRRRRATAGAVCRRSRFVRSHHSRLPQVQLMPADSDGESVLRR